MSAKPVSSGTRRFFVWWLAGLGLSGAVLVLAGSRDLRLSLWLVDPHDRFGVLIARWGEWPGWIAVVASVVVLLLDRRWRRDPPSRSRRGSRPGWSEVVTLAWSVCLLALAHPLLITQSLKALWGRVRFAQLSAGFADYTPFWIPAGIGAGASFPSGHVAMAMVPAPLPFHLWRQGRRALAVAAAAGVLAVGVAVAAGRIVAGKHFLSDTVFSIAVALLLAPLLVRQLARE